MTQQDPRLQRLKKLIERQVTAMCVDYDLTDWYRRHIEAHLNGTIEAAWPAIMEGEEDGSGRGHVPEEEG